MDADLDLERFLAEEPVARSRELIVWNEAMRRRKLIALFSAGIFLSLAVVLPEPLYLASFGLGTFALAVLATLMWVGEEAMRFRSPDEARVHFGVQNLLSMAITWIAVAAALMLRLTVE